MSWWIAGVVLAHLAYFTFKFAWMDRYWKRRVLRLLNRRKGLELFGRDIAKAVGIGYGNVYTYLASLEDDGLVTYRTIDTAYIGTRRKYRST